MIALFSRLIILSFGTLYPAYASYKAVRTKNVKEYVKWMMYWIVYAFFTCIETFTDIFLSWFPFYYEVKVVLVLWLLSPATKGSSVLYRKFVHPMLTRREQDIDEYLNQAKERGYSAVLELGSKGVNYATNVIMQTALKTIQYAGDGRRKLSTSQSDNTIFGGLVTNQDECDAYSNDRDLHLDIHNRSRSLNAIRSMDIEFSEEEVQIETTTTENVTLVDESENTAARLRASSNWKKKLRNRTIPTNKPKTNAKVVVKGLRGRRRLREDSSSDVEVE